MNIAIIGNGQSALKVTYEDLIDKDLIVRIKLGGVKPLSLYRYRDIVKKEHHIIINPYNLKTLSQKEISILFSLYKKIFFLSYFFSNEIIRPCSEQEIKDKILSELTEVNKLEIKNLFVLSYFNLYKEKLHEFKKFNVPFYNHIKDITKNNNNTKVLHTRHGSFSSIKTMSMCEDLQKIKAFIKKHNDKDFLLYPSVGLSAILTYLYLYPNAKIYLYGYDFNNDTGWFWSKEHKHSKMTHNFAYEKEFIIKTPLFSNVNIM